MTPATCRVCRATTPDRVAAEWLTLQCWRPGAAGWAADFCSAACVQVYVSHRVAGVDT